MRALDTWSAGGSRVYRRLPGAVLYALALQACIVEESRCDANEVRTSTTTSVCECAPGFVLSAAGYGCDPCGPNQEVSGGKCVCAAGFQLSQDGSNCEPVAGSYPGKSCSPSDPCTDPAPLCLTWSNESYCTTRGCTRNGECPPGWLCESADGGFCRQPTGLLDDCQSDAQCAGTDATFCERVQSFKCLIQECATNPSVCPSSYVCCDFEAFLGRSLCLPDSTLMGGVCLDGKAPVQP